jgi:hypothetical protein
MTVQYHEASCEYAEEGGFSFCSSPDADTRKISDYAERRRFIFIGSFPYLFASLLTWTRFLFHDGVDYAVNRGL